jgi:hypothetical protein
MRTAVIHWKGTVYGESTVDIEDDETVQDAIVFAEDVEYGENVDITEYPTDWEIEKEYTVDCDNM